MSGKMRTYGSPNCILTYLYVILLRSKFIHIRSYALNLNPLLVIVAMHL